MKTQVFLFFNTEERPWSIVSELFNDAQRPDMVLAGPNFLSFYSVKFDEDDPRLKRFRIALSTAGIQWLERREHIFTKAEIEASPLLWLTIRTRERAAGGPQYGTAYDLAKGCPQCGTGAVQISPLRLNPSEIPKKGVIFQTFDDERLVSPGLARVLSEAQITGLELRRAHSYTGLANLPWAQLIAPTELPLMASSSKGILREDPCPLCGRDGYFNDAYTPTEIEYDNDQVVLDALPDVVHTYEHFGNSRLRTPFNESHFAQPLLLVKPKVLKVFQQKKVRGVEFVPINLREV
jgi:hypothetical protein